MPRITYDYIKNLSPSELGKMKKSEVINILKGARKKYNTRKNQLEKVAGTVWSPSLEKMEAYYSETKPVAISKVSRNKALNEILQIQSFLQSETSSVQGARRVMREQDIRIFGMGASGRPKHRMTVTQRTQFWAAYNEFISMNKTSVTVFGSNAIQQYLGEAITGRGKIEFTPEAFNKMLSDLREQRESESYEFETANVFSGRDWDNSNR